MATVEIKNSELLKAARLEFDKRVGGLVSDETARKMYETLFISSTAFLAVVKTTKNPVALIVDDTEGNFIIAGVVEYNEAPEKEDDVLGNWNYYWTFSKDDLPENTTIYNIKDTQSHSVIIQTSWEKTSARFEGTESLINTFIIAFDILKDFLYENAREGDTYELVYPGVFTAMAAIEDGEKVISITPDGLLKKMIKDDAAVEKESKTA
ncbi:MAG: hypothetical protein PHC62_00095 [Candidatus Izemoplasmatales bacterium]|nr:hypothetical protein [Candidatus Izemoplasmatales bacterium]